jgi:hypothetical protein
MIDAREIYACDSYFPVSINCFILVKNISIHPIRETQYETSKAGISIRIRCVFTLKVLVGQTGT